MVRLTSERAIWCAVALFIITSILSYYLTPLYLTCCGFIVPIFLSIYIQRKYSEAIAAVAAVLALIMITYAKDGNLFSKELVWANTYFVIILVISVLIARNARQLFQHMQFDKTHMTSLFENATEGIILTNGKGKIVLVNPSAEKIFGYSQHELTGRLIEVLIPDRSKTGHEKLRDGFYHHPQNRQMGIGRDLFARKKSGTEFPVEVSLSYYKQNKESFVIAFVVDITARKIIELDILNQQNDLEKLTEEMRVLNSELEIKVEQRTEILTEALQRLEQSQKELSDALNKERELNEIKSRFVSMASHEFRTPLTTILSSASLLSKYTITEEQDKRDRHIHRVKDSVKHLNDILEDFLSLGKSDEGKVSTSFVLFDLNDLLQDVIEEMKAQIKDGQRIEYAYEGKGEIYSDKKLLRNILINLISNAVKFSEEGKVVSVICKITDDKGIISIKDEGMGIPTEDLPYLFSSFFRSKNAVNIQGTGLGLHIVQRYLNLLKGSINVDTQLGKGTTFTIILSLSN